MAKTKTLISCAATAQLICVFVFAYCTYKAGFNDAAHVNVIGLFGHFFFVFCQTRFVLFMSLCVILQVVETIQGIHVHV